MTSTNAERVEECVHWPVCLWERQECAAKSLLCACVFWGEWEWRPELIKIGLSIRNRKKKKKGAFMYKIHSMGNQNLKRTSYFRHVARCQESSCCVPERGLLCSTLSRYSTVFSHLLPCVFKGYSSNCNFSGPFGTRNRLRSSARGTCSINTKSSPPFSGLCLQRPS